jgi:hypothetical protein
MVAGGGDQDQVRPARTTHRGLGLSSPLRAGAIAGLAGGALLVGILHVVSDIDPIGHRLSEYVVESGGSLMTASFLASGLGVACLGMAIGRVGVGGVRSIVVALALVGAGAGLAVAGLFPTDVTGETQAELVHSRASGAATVLIIGASLVWSAERSRRPRRPPLALAIAGLLLGVVSVFLHDTALSGLGQRGLWLALVTWALAAAIMIEPPGGLPATNSQPPGSLQ